MRYTAADELPAEHGLGIRSRLRQVHPDLSAIRLERVGALSQTVAGKTQMIIRR
jgi:hypothetical protein